MSSFKIKQLVVLAGSIAASVALGLPLGSQAATSAPAPKPPTAHTGSASQASASSATLRGAVNPRGVETSYVFQYGTTTAYGAQTPTVSAGSGTAAVQVSQPITGLQPYTTYHCRLVAMSAVGTTSGQDAAFTTKKIPLTFKIAATPDQVVFGSSFSVSGVLSGTGAANQEIVLQAKPFPYLGGFKNTGNPKVTDAGGSFSFPVTHLPGNTQFRVITVNKPIAKSPTVIERVALRVSLHLSSTGRPGFVRMRGMVKPAEVGARVVYQLLRRGHPPLNVGSTKSTKIRRASASASRFSSVVRIRRGGLYRALVRVNNGKQVPGHSRALLIR